jgi:hypothetical protein
MPTDALLTFGMLKLTSLILDGIRGNTYSVAIRFRASTEEPSCQIDKIREHTEGKSIVVKKKGMEIGS